MQNYELTYTEVGFFYELNDFTLNDRMKNKIERWATIEKNAKAAVKDVNVARQRKRQLTNKKNDVLGI